MGSSPSKNDSNKTPSEESTKPIKDKELLLNKEQQSGITSYLEYNGMPITMSGNKNITLGNTTEIGKKKSPRKKTCDAKKLTQGCNSSNVDPSITVNGSTLTISGASGVHISDKGITVGGKKYYDA